MCVRDGDRGEMNRGSSCISSWNETSKLWWWIRTELEIEKLNYLLVDKGLGHSVGSVVLSIPLFSKGRSSILLLN